MSEPFLGEVRMFGFNFAPRGWALCNGQILPINQNQSLYSLLGTTYGGDGRTVFALPDLRGRTPVHQGSAGGPNRGLGQRFGQEFVTLTVAQMPAHTHTVPARDQAGNSGSPASARFAGSQTVGGGRQDILHSDRAPDATLASSAVANAGGGQAHFNMQPYQVVNFGIALQGLFPSRN
ncbi:MAG: tail fiber protein [Bacteroidota bacterium]